MSRIMARLGRFYPELMCRELQVEKLYSKSTSSAKYVSSSNNDSDHDDGDQDLNDVLSRLGYSNLEQLYKDSQSAQMFDKVMNPSIRKSIVESSQSQQIEDQLSKWRLKEEKTAKRSKISKIMTLMGVSSVANEKDIEIISKAPSKALRNL